jgi:hypothetical protein
MKGTPGLRGPGNWALACPDTTRPYVSNPVQRARRSPPLLPVYTCVEEAANGDRRALGLLILRRQTARLTRQTVKHRQLGRGGCSLSMKRPGRLL